MNDLPVTFERRAGGCLVARLGDVEVGCVVPGGYGQRPWWRTTLPDDPVRAPRPVHSIEEGQRQLGEHVWQWMERAGVLINRSPRPAPVPAYAHGKRGREQGGASA